MEIRSVTIDSENTPLGRLELRRFEAETGEVGYEILIDGAFLMASHGCHSERAMARLAHERLRDCPEGTTVLVGGLGAGHTLRAVLDLPGIQRVVVAEIGRKVEAWNRRWFAPFNGDAVDDPRVEVVVADVLQVIQDSPGAFDLVLLDVDNGPGWLAAPGNAALYDVAGLRACRASVRPGGVLAVWTPDRNEVLGSALTAAFGEVEAVDTSSEGRCEREPGSVVYLAVAPHR